MRSEPMRQPLARAGRALATRTCRPLVHLAREGAARASLMRHSLGQGAVAVFLPAGPPEGAALLRIYNIAEALRPLGWRTAVLPWKLTLSQRRRYLAAAHPDVVVMQGARHVLNRPAYYPEWPIVYDMDDADFHLAHLRRPVTEAMGQVARVIAGSHYIADWALGQGARQADVVWTGTPVSHRPRTPQVGRPPVVAWAQTRPMTYKREAALVAGVMARVAATHPGVTLRLYDRRPTDDPAFADMFRARGLTVEWQTVKPYDAFLASLDDVAIGLAPLCPETPFSRGKSFGKVLAYLDRQVPVVASEVCEHPGFFSPSTGCLSDDPDVWVGHIARLLADPARRHSIADVAYAQFADRLSVAAAAQRVSGMLTDILRAPSQACLAV